MKSLFKSFYDYITIQRNFYNEVEKIKGKHIILNQRKLTIKGAGYNRNGNLIVIFQYPVFWKFVDYKYMLFSEFVDKLIDKEIEIID